MKSMFSIHTAEIIRIMTKNESQELMSMTRGEFKNYIKNGNEYHFYIKSPGIRMFLQFSRDAPTTLRLIVNLNAIYGGDENILLNPIFKDINKVFLEVDNVFEENNLWIRLRQFTVGRIDTGNPGA